MSFLCKTPNPAFNKDGGKAAVPVLLVIRAAAC
jgi:hypothetical protein